MRISLGIDDLFFYTFYSLFLVWFFSCCFILTLLYAEIFDTLTHGYVI